MKESRFLPRGAVDIVDGKLVIMTPEMVAKNLERQAKIEREKNLSIPEYCPRISRKDPLWGVTDLADKTKIPWNGRKR